MSAVSTASTLASQARTSQRFWEEVGFESKISNPTASKKFIKHLSAITLANICYIRTNLPETAFSCRQLDRSTSVRLLTSEQNGAVCVILNNFEAAMKAFQDDYLEELQVFIYTDRLKRYETVEELYTFSFGKSNSKEFFELLNQKRRRSLGRFHADANGQEIYRNSVKKVMRTVTAAVEGLPTLPTKAYMGFNITLRPETPANYLLNGFEPSSVIINKKGGHFDHSFKTISTGYHKWSLKLQGYGDGGDEATVVDQDATQPASEGHSQAPKIPAIARSPTEEDINMNEGLDVSNTTVDTPKEGQRISKKRNRDKDVSILPVPKRFRHSIPTWDKSI